MRRLWLVAAALLGVAGTALTAVVLGRGGGLSVLHVLLTPTVGWSFGLAGLVACRRERWRRVGALMVAVGLAWFVHLLDWAHLPAVTAAAAPLRNAYAAVFAHLLLAFPSGRLGSRWVRLLVAAGYLDLVGVQSLAVTLDASGLGRSPATGWYGVESAAGVGLAALVMAVLVRRVLRAPAGGRQPAVVVWCAALVAAAALVGNLVSGWVAPRLELGLWVVFSAAFAAVPFGFLASLLGVRLRRARVAALLVRLSRVTEPAQLRDAIADALGDPALELVFWVPDRRCHVDPGGHQVELPTGGGARAVSVVRHDGRRVAALVHGAGVPPEDGLVAAVSATAGLALDNARLHAELRARLAELTESRTRLVEAGAAERRRIERNLHDGAQQRLVAVAFALAVAEAQLPRDCAAIQLPGDRVAAQVPGGCAAAHRTLGEARAGLSAAIDELRRLSHGIHPGILVERGLRTGLDELAWTSPVPTTVTWTAADRLPDPVELAGYYLVAEALANAAKHAQATAIRVGVVQRHGRVSIEVTDDGTGGADPAGGSGLRGLADRIAALDGTFTVVSEAGAGTTVRAELPCG